MLRLHIGGQLTLKVETLLPAVVDGIVQLRQYSLTDLVCDLHLLRLHFHDTALRPGYRRHRSPLLPIAAPLSPGPIELLDLVGDIFHLDVLDPRIYG